MYVFFLFFPETMPFLVQLLYFPEIHESETIRICLFAVVVNIHNFKMLLVQTLKNPSNPIFTIPILIILQTILTPHPTKNPTSLNPMIILFKRLPHLLNPFHRPLEIHPAKPNIPLRQISLLNLNFLIPRSNSFQVVRIEYFIWSVDDLIHH